MTGWTPAHTWVCDQTRTALWVLSGPRRVGKTYARRRLLRLAVLASALTQNTPPKG